jgi:hypothetical protein
MATRHAATHFVATSDGRICGGWAFYVDAQKSTVCRMFFSEVLLAWQLLAITGYFDFL